MKRILNLSLIFISLSVQGQTDTTEMPGDSVKVQVVELPDSTAIGAPDGKPVSKEIGPTGGTIISDDKRVELIFPEGALADGMNITIQPITNLIPNGNGKGYQFEPSGIQFKKPVQIIFHYTDQDDQACPAFLKFMAIQDKDGTWEYMDYEDWDSTAKTLKGFISHFSAYIDGSSVKLNSSDITLRVGHSFSFYLTKVKPPQKKQKSSKNTEGDELPPLPSVNVSMGSKKINWYVNNTEYGDEKIGKIIPETGEKIQANYVAPATLPIDQSITVTLKVNLNLPPVTKVRRGKAKMLTFNNTTSQIFNSNVQLYDAYEIKVVGVWDNLVPDQATERMKDSAICGFKLTSLGTTSTWTETNIQNSLFIMEKQNCQKKCECKYVNENSCTGVIEISGISKISVSDSTNVWVYFKPAKATSPQFKITCPRSSGAVPSFPMPFAIPRATKFEMRDGEQEQDLSDNIPTVITGKITIRRLTE